MWREGAWKRLKWLTAHLGTTRKKPNKRGKTIILQGWGNISLWEERGAVACSLFEYVRIHWFINSKWVNTWFGNQLVFNNSLVSVERLQQAKQSFKWQTEPIKTNQHSLIWTTTTVFLLHCYGPVTTCDTACWDWLNWGDLKGKQATVIF